MDSLVEAFDSSARVSFDEYDTHSKHPRFSQYKQRTEKNSQEDRRKKFLLDQKKKKINTINSLRGIPEDSWNSIEEELKKTTKTNNRPYKDALMLSEWLVDVPEDFLEKWIAVPSPLGKRVLLVAEKGVTMAYSRKGFVVVEKFQSLLPGGSHKFNRGRTSLDCIWHMRSKIFYVLDVLSWGPFVTDCEAEFRFSWLEWKYDEKGGVSKLGQESDDNRFRIIIIERVPCSQLPALVSKPSPFSSGPLELDGFIFFHREGLYEAYGKSPLVTWLKPHMIQEILGLETHPDYQKSLLHSCKMELGESSPSQPPKNPGKMNL